MRMIGAFGLAGLLIAGLGWAQSAAQGVPPGTYLRRCGEVHMRGDTLVATCRGMDGSARRTSLPGVQNCVGDIGNMNGQLTCNYAGAPAVLQSYYCGPREEPRDYGVIAAMDRLATAGGRMRALRRVVLAKTEIDCC